MIRAIALLGATTLLAGCAAPGGSPPAAGAAGSTARASRPSTMAILLAIARTMGRRARCGTGAMPFSPTDMLARQLAHMRRSWPSIITSGIRMAKVLACAMRVSNKAPGLATSPSWRSMIRSMVAVRCCRTPSGRKA